MNTIDKKQDTGILCIYYILHTYRIYENLYYIKNICKYSKKEISMKAIIYCLQQYHMKIRTINTISDMNKKMPCIGYSKEHGYCIIHKKTTNIYLLIFPYHKYMFVKQVILQSLLDSCYIQMEHVGRNSNREKQTIYSTLFHNIVRIYYREIVFFIGSTIAQYFLCLLAIPFLRYSLLSTFYQLLSLLLAGSIIMLVIGKQWVYKRALRKMSICDIRSMHLIIALKKVIHVIIRSISFAIVCIVYISMKRLILQSIVLMIYSVYLLISILLVSRKKRAYIYAWDYYMQGLQVEREQREGVDQKIHTISFEQVAYTEDFVFYPLQYSNFVITSSTWMHIRDRKVQMLFIALLHQRKSVVEGGVFLNTLEIDTWKEKALKKRICIVSKDDTSQETIFTLLSFGSYMVHTEALVIMEIIGQRKVVSNLHITINDLSVEQRQMIMCVYTILKKPDILIVDAGFLETDRKTRHKILLYLDMFVTETIVIILDTNRPSFTTKYPIITL